MGDKHFQISCNYSVKGYVYYGTIMLWIHSIDYMKHYTISLYHSTQV